MELNVYFNYFYTETVRKAYLLSYFFIYSLLKKIYYKDKKFNYKIIVTVIVNILIKQITGFSKNLIVNSFKISLGFRNWQGFTNFHNSWFYILIPIVSNQYIEIEKYKIYFENDIIKFNPLDSFNKINTKITNDIEKNIIKNRDHINHFNVLINKLNIYITVKDLQIKNINSIHTCFVCDYFKNDYKGISTLTNVKNKINLKELFIIENKITEKKSKILEPIIIKNDELIEYPIKRLSLNDTRNLLNNKNYLNLYLLSLKLNVNYNFLNEFSNNQNNLEYKEEVGKIIYDYKNLYNKEILNLNNYSKNIFFLTYIKIDNKILFENILIKENNDYIDEIIFNHP